MRRLLTSFLAIAALSVLGFGQSSSDQFMEFFNHHGFALMDYHEPKHDDKELVDISLTDEVVMLGDYGISPSNEPQFFVDRAKGKVVYVFPNHEVIRRFNRNLQKSEEQ